MEKAAGFSNVPKFLKLEILVLAAVSGDQIMSWRLVCKEWKALVDDSPVLKPRMEEYRALLGFKKQLKEYSKGFGKKSRIEHKIIVDGQSMSGKSSFSVRYMQGIYQEIQSGVAESYRKQVEHWGLPFQVDYLDMSMPSEQWAYARDQYYRLGEGFFLLYGADQENPSKNLKKLYDHIYSVKDEEYVPIIIICAKCDLPERKTTKEQALKELEGKRFSYFEVSAKDGTGVNEAFEEMVLLITKKKLSEHKEELPEEKKRKKCWVF